MIEESLSLTNIKRLKKEMDERIFNIEQTIEKANPNGTYFVELTKYLSVLSKIRLYLIEEIENYYS